MSTAQAIDDTLSIVKDAGRFKTRLAELAEATAAHEASARKAKADNKETFAARDAHLAQHQERLNNVQARVKAGEADVENAMKPVRRAEAELAQNKETLDRCRIKLERDQAAFTKLLAEHHEHVEDFNAKVKRFESVVEALCKVVK